VRSWLMYWRPDTGRGGFLDHAASDQLGKLTPAEEVWFVTIENHDLILFGHMLVGERMSQSWAEAVLGKDIWKAKYHIVPKGSPEPFREGSITLMAHDLRFQGGVQQLPPEYSGRNLQTMRELSPESVEMLRRVWNRPLRS
jgi:hypothetical protein